MSWGNQYQSPSGPPPSPFRFPQPTHFEFSSGSFHGGSGSLCTPDTGPPLGPPGFPQPETEANSPGSYPSYSPPFSPLAGPPPIPGNRPDKYTSPPSSPPTQRRDTDSSVHTGQSHGQSHNGGDDSDGWDFLRLWSPGEAPIDRSEQNQGTTNCNDGTSPARDSPEGNTGYGTGGPGHPGSAPQLGNAHMPPSGPQVYGPSEQGTGPTTFFQYSMGTGRKKALIIGINYIGQKGKLRGCINDSNNFRAFLCRQFSYKDEDIVQLVDDSLNPRQQPTRANIIDAMKWLVKDAQPNDSLFFHYSGHGGQTKDIDGDEDDGLDEVIYPVDFEKSGHIIDDDMHSIMVRPLPPGCRLTAIFDSCHSGSALDLPYVYSTEGKIQEPDLLAEGRQRPSGAVQGLPATTRGLPAAKRGPLAAKRGLLAAKRGLLTVKRSLLGATLLYAGAEANMLDSIKAPSAPPEPKPEPKPESNEKIEAYNPLTRTSPADVISWSGCKDSQTSVDTVEDDEATGAMSYAFIAALTRQPLQSYQQLLNSIRDILKDKYEQEPQLSSSHPIDTTVLFIA